jgi:AraC family transcriptional regulator of adaptative response / DNA-3-methyladenine glycosylase II
MRIEDDTCYRALAARDARFDGLFFVGVTTTGIYCRPICTARAPGRDRCRFFVSSAMAERDGFRPCLRCRPELAPGLAPVDSLRRVACAAASRIESGALNGEGSLEKLARDLRISSRQLRRAIRHEFGVSPIELAQTQRLLLAKQLLGESDLPIIDVAYASGFASVRRFNALFQSHYRLTPSRMRRAASSSRSAGRLRLTLGYRPPLAWDPLLRFLADRATAGVEWTSQGAYYRTAIIGSHHGWIKVEPVQGRNALAVELATPLLPVLPEVLTRLKNQFDLSARPDVIGNQLAAEPRLRKAVERYPGLRVPGAFDGFEMAVRAILGQRISVKAATTLAGRVTATFGEPIETPIPGLSRIGPSAERLATVHASALTSLGISSARAGTIRALASAVASGQLDLQPGLDPESAMTALQALPGVGDWTAQYIAMRALRWPDAFPAGDLGLLKAFGERSPRRLLDLAAAWKPWRAYAAMYLWQCHDLERTESSHEGHRNLSL